jgi:transcriptional regulator with XRE-family HTH domain
MSGNLNDALRHQRLLRGWSLQRVADEICAIGFKVTGKKPGVNCDMVGEWERGIKMPSPYYREKLCLLYNVTADQLNLITPVAPQTTSSLVVSRNLVDDMDKKRREVVQLLTLAGAALVIPLPLPNLDWEHIEDTIDKPSRLDQVVIKDFEGINSHLWSIYLAASAKSSVMDGVVGQLKMLVQFLREPHTASVHKRLCMLISELSQLAGEIHFDRHEYETAQSCYVFAANAAKEVQAYDLWSCALVRHSFIPIYDQEPRYRDALPYLYGARYLAEQGDSNLSTRYWVAAVEAEAESGVHNLTACQNALERANGVQELNQVVSPAWTRFDGSRLPALHGACYVRLQEPGPAIPALREALGQFTKLGRKRGMVLLDLAMAATLGRDAEQACTYLDEVATIVQQGSSGFLKEGIVKVRQQLIPFAGAADVSRLDQRLHLLA